MLLQTGRNVYRCYAEDEIAGLKELFHRFDTDHSGTITFDELRVGLEKTGARTASDELLLLMQSLAGRRVHLLDPK